MMNPRDRGQAADDSLPLNPTFHRAPVPIPKTMPAPQRSPPSSLAPPHEVFRDGRQSDPANNADSLEHSQVPLRPPRPSRMSITPENTKRQHSTQTAPYRTGKDISANSQPDMVLSESRSISHFDLDDSQDPPARVKDTIPKPSVHINAPGNKPLPAPVAATPSPRRGVNLGPPPLARRGPPSFYTNNSYVSPIPEESPRSQSQSNYEPSLDMRNNWESSSTLAASPKYADAPSPSPSDLQSFGMGRFGNKDNSRSEFRGAGGGGDEISPFGEGTRYLVAPSSTSATDAATAKDLPNPGRRVSMSPQPSFHNGSVHDTETRLERPLSQLSAIRQAPRPYPDAARKAEARGSLTSLPDLIRRATRLAASLDRGKRPASRIDELDMSSGMDDLGIRSSEGDKEKLQPGLSDMLAAFPSPAQPNRRSFRQTLREQVGAWPAPLAIAKGGRLSGQPMQTITGSSPEPASPEHHHNRNRRRCCCLPLWGFFVFAIVTLIIIIAAVVIPLEILVVHKQRHGGNSAMSKCQSQITCENGGSVVVSTQGVCSCICTNGFGGSHCSIAGDNGCTTTTFASTASTSSTGSVTLGNAIPRLIEQAHQNFSISLSGTQIVSVFSASNLSCVAENALVTFDGEASRRSSSGSTVITAFLADNDDTQDIGVSLGSAAIAETTVSIKASPSKAKRGVSTIVTAPAGASSDAGKILPTQSDKTLRISTQITPSVVSPTSLTTFTTTFTPLQTSGGSAAIPTGSVAASAMFEVTEDVLDFARVAVLFILQQESLENAELAQSDLQRFFTQASASYLTNGNGVSVEAASNVTIGNSNSINLVQLQVDVANTLHGTGIPA
ncbi:hypothetical protein SEPCBS119000_005207 [Sporothrix epigloea]|uniref:EGF-like domain-containing protein n=1 Tax=Sporothrix epigloea TaxID=1892477 RepID=A0ABP0DYI4_9PEZI